MGRNGLARIRRAERRDDLLPEIGNRLHELPVRFQKGCALEKEFLSKLRGEDGWRLKMAEYHVGCGAFGIYAGTLNSKNKNLWQNKTECTDEALCAVRDYLVQECLGGLHGDKSSGGYKWTLKDGRVVKLLVAIENVGDNDAVD